MMEIAQSVIGDLEDAQPDETAVAEHLAALKQIWKPTT